MTSSKAWQASLVLLVLTQLQSVLPRPVDTDVRGWKEKHKDKDKEKKNGPPAWAMSHGKGKTREGFLDGDILMDNETLALQEHAINGNPLTSRTAVLPKGNVHLWPNGQVPYEFDNTFDSYPSSVNAIKSAMNQLEQLSCVRFMPKASADSYWIRFTRGAGCSSYVGRLQPSQAVSIGASCDTNVIILHELYHALGFFHTSSRPDRDSYVIVYKENIISGYQHNFDRYTTSQVDTLSTPFDFNSIMQLHRQSWSKNGLNTIESRKGPIVNIGGATELSPIDKQMLNDLYSCNKPGCYYELGMNSKRIPDSHVTAYSNAQYAEAHYARLHRSDGYVGAWCANSNAYGEWLQIDFGTSKKVTGVATQGKVDLFEPTWVSGYRIQYGDGSYWWWYNGGEVLPGNFDTISVQYNQLSSSITANLIRIIPATWKAPDDPSIKAICMRVELYGCKVNVLRLGAKVHPLVGKFTTRVCLNCGAVYKTLADTPIPRCHLPLRDAK